MLCERCNKRPLHTRKLCKICRQKEKYDTDPEFRARRQASARRYYHNLANDKKRRLYNRIYDYNKANPDLRRGWVKTWRLHTGRALPPELVEFRTAVNFLEEAVATTKRSQGVRQPGSERGDDAA